MFKKTRLESDALQIEETESKITQLLDVDMDINRLINQPFNYNNIKSIPCGCCQLLYLFGIRSQVSN